MWKGYRRVSRGSVFLLAMVALVCLLFLGTSLVQVAIHGLSFASKQQKRAQALAFAEAGVEMVLEKFYDGYGAHAGYPTPTDELDTTGQFIDDFTLGDGTVHVVVTAPFETIPQSCEIRSTGLTRTHQQETVRVIAVYKNDDDRAFKGAIFCNDNLKLSGGGQVLPDADGVGASVYAKGYIDFSGKSFEIDPPDPDRIPPQLGGDGAIFSASDTISDYPDGVKPQNVLLGISPLPMPAIDIAEYRRIAQDPTKGGTYINKSQQNFSGQTDFSTYCSAPSYLIFVEGSVSITGNYSGKAAIVATGTIKVSGGGIVSSGGAGDALALISPKGVDVRGDATIDALIYSHGVSMMDSHGGANVNGSVIIRGAVVADIVETKGAITVQYDSSVWGGLPIPGKGRSQYQQISWEELIE